MTQLDLKKWVLAVLAFLVVLTCGLLLGGYASTYSQQEQQHTLQQQAVTYAGYIEQSAQNMTAITAELERQGQNAPKVNGMAVPQWLLCRSIQRLLACSLCLLVVLLVHILLIRRFCRLLFCRES